jgi:hypothetical protein
MANSWRSAAPRTDAAAFYAIVLPAQNGVPAGRSTLFFPFVYIMSDDNFKATEVTRDKAPQEPDPNQKFWDMADTFIQLANENCKGATLGQVCASMMYASARFGAFTASVDAPDEAAFKQQLDGAIKYFQTEYEKMLRVNFREHADNFKSYHPEKK